MVSQTTSQHQRAKIFYGGKRAFGGQKYTKYNKIYNNSENFRAARLLPVASLS